MYTVKLELSGVQSIDLPILDDFIKKFKIKSKVVTEEDDTKMTKEEYFRMIDEARKSEYIEMSREELRKIMFK